MIHIFVQPMVADGIPITTFFLCHGHSYLNPNYITHSSQPGVDQTQALCLAVQTTVDCTIALKPTHIHLWLRPLHMVNCLLTLSPHRDTHITYDTHAVLLTFLSADPSHLLYVQAIGPNWPGTPPTLEHWRLAMDPTLRGSRPTQPINAATAKQAM